MKRDLARREFLLGAAAAAAAVPGLSGLARAAVSGQEPAPPPTALANPMPRATAIRSGGFRKALKIGMVQEGESLHDKFALVKELGFDGIELDSPSGLDTAEVQAARDATGLVVHGVVDSAHWGKPFSHPDAAVRAEGTAALRTALADAQAYGASTVLVVPAVVSKDVSYATAWERAHAEIAAVLPEAEERGIHVAFENVWNNFLLSPLEAVRWIDSFDSPNVGMYFDVGNVVRFGWPEHWIEALGPRILKVDVKEYSRKKQMDEGPWKGFGVELHEGDCDWPSVVAALRRTGYEGWFTLEVGGGGRERWPRLAADVDRIFAS